MSEDSTDRFTISEALYLIELLRDAQLVTLTDTLGVLRFIDRLPGKARQVADLMREQEVARQARDKASAQISGVKSEVRQILMEGEAHA